jgi:tripartite-type tricarboxylate transporter receptor subunit TctC
MVATPMRNAQSVWRRISCIAILASFLNLPAFVTSASAENYPSRAVRFILPFGAASATDITARLFADRLAARWGKPVVIENRPGGDGLVSVSAFLGANDDHTLLFGPAGTFALHRYESSKPAYEAERDLVPVASVSNIILALSVSAGLKINSIGELVALARAQPGKLNAAAASGISDFLLLGFLRSSGLEVAKVPYRDILQAPNDLAEGRIDILMTSLAVVQPQMEARRVKVIAVTSRERPPIAQEIPTVAQAGFPELEMESLVGLFGPRVMANAVRERIAADIAAVFDPVIGTRLAATGQIVRVLGPAQFAAGIEVQRAKLAEIAKTLGFR